MISRRHSVFFKLHAFFFLALIVLILLFISALHEQEQQKLHLLAQPINGTFPYHRRNQSARLYGKKS
ncbi:hypothetical protein B649_09395 [Candidatus Sulfuricurvum sp. RIFRC-1]|nr:hypothetical protein B649_09395 [Candidatus Sulfuricurvum sp. RIFRC-1]